MKQRHGPAARDGAAAPPPDHTAPTRGAKGPWRRMAVRLQVVMVVLQPFGLRQLGKEEDAGMSDPW